ncbi:hypothetical protein MPTA5024_11040 [Microbispora sp. ATCC PTA-5024]|nr:hypothetical protein MPTA5024_11040 [Microbispora sp. ATCC PTA-5024]
MGELIRHVPPCSDPGCDPCYADATDEEMYRLFTTEETTR